MSDPIRAHPDLQAEAERRAQALHRILFGRDAEGSRLQAWIEAHIDLLLADPDGLARVLAARVGIEVGATAPHIGRYVCGEHCCDGERGRMVPCSRPIWSLMGADETQMVTFADCPDVDEWDGDDRRHVPNVGAILDPLQSLHAALAATEPRTP